MSKVKVMDGAGYTYIPGVFQYSGGVAALPGYEIVRVRFKTPLPLEEGFASIERHLKDVERPNISFCACELRSPAPFTDAEFEAFNRIYFGTLEKWGIIRDNSNPVARSCVCPEKKGPSEPCLYAFCYTREATHGHQTFVVSGSAECPEGAGNYIDQAVCYGDQSETGMQKKADWVLSEMERRMTALDANWSDVTATHLYTVYDMHAPLRAEIAERGALPNSLNWHFARPPVVSLDFEMDVRRVLTEELVI